MKLPNNLNRAVKALSKLPGIGQKTAQRLVFYLMTNHKDLAAEIAETLDVACKETRLCELCCNLTDQSPCAICSDTERDNTVICVVESPVDVLSLERTGEYHGLYHVLHGAISPGQNITGEDIHLRELLHRLIGNAAVEEIILANNATLEGEATAHYISRLLKDSGIRISQMAQGIPVGSGLEYADEITLAKAIAGRQRI